jgi:hypothetical protein
MRWEFTSADRGLCLSGWCASFGGDEEPGDNTSKHEDVVSEERLEALSTWLEADNASRTQIGGMNSPQ